MQQETINIDLKLPTRWENLSDKQLLYVFALLAQGFTATEQVERATHALDWLDSVPTLPVRLAKIGSHRATDAIGQMKLPAYKAQSGDDFTRITLFPKKNVKDMTREERIAACYQHACLLYEDGQSINNMSVRERFNLNKNQTVLASRILSDTQQAGLIKPVNPEMDAKRYYAYIPYYC